MSADSESSEPALSGTPIETLQDALAASDVALPPEQVETLDRYCRLLWDWNTRLNLTRHTNYTRFVTRDIVDTLKLGEQLGPCEKVLDVGTGGGVPGIVLAIIRPDLEVSLCESVAKKARAVGEIVTELGLHAPTYHSRAEDLFDQHTFNTLVARAVAPLAKLLTWLEPHWGSFDRLLVIKGPSWVEERREARQRHLLDDLRLRKLATWPLPESTNESVLLEICPNPDGG